MNHSRGVPLENREVDVSDFENFEIFLIVTDSKEVKLGWMAVMSSLAQRCIPKLVTLRFASFFRAATGPQHQTAALAGRAAHNGTSVTTASRQRFTFDLSSYKVTIKNRH